jgi:hypothetical protein
MGLRAGRPGFDYSLLHSVRPTLRPTLPPIQWVPGALSPGVNRQGREADHSPPSSAEIKKGGVIPSPPPPTRLYGVVLN